MQTLREWMHRVWGSVRQNSTESELEEELRAHLEFACQDMQSRGSTPEEAQRAARLAVGGVAQAMESMRDQRGLPWIEGLRCDLRYAFRTIRRHPGFATLVVLIMATGIGANTAVFSVVNAVLLGPLEYRNPDRIVSLTNPLTTGESASPIAVKQVAIPNFQDWHDQSSSFEAMAFYYSWEAPVMTGQTAEGAQVTKVSPEFFRVFGVEPVIGRSFNTEESKPNASGALMISYAFWQSHFGGDPRVLGRTMRLYSNVLPIVGVLPPGFGFPNKTVLWFPDNDDSVVFHSRDAQNHLVVGRLKPGVPIERAQTEMATIARRLARQYPATNKNKIVAVTRIQDEMVGDVRPTLYLLLGSVGFVLLIACANTATLLLGRVTARTREVAVRTTLGASQRRIVRQLITESVLLALLAGGAGLLLAYGGAKTLGALAPTNSPRFGETGIDRSVLVFTLGVSVVTSLLFGLVPAVYAAKVDLNSALKQSAARSVLGGRMLRMRGWLVVGEIALAVVLLSAAGLLIKSFVALHNVALGFRPDNVLVMKASGPGSIRATNLFFKDVLAQIATVPGVVAVGATMALPGHVESSGYYSFDHEPEHRDPTAPVAAISIIAPGTFAALGIPLKRGRDFNEGDLVGRPLIAVVNEALVRESLQGEDPTGRTIFCPFDSDKGMIVVGVVGDVRERGPARGPTPECYLPYRQHFYNNSTLNVVTRTTGDPADLESTLRRLAHQRSPDVPVSFTTLERDTSEIVAAPRFRTLLLGIFAALAVFLAMAGVYGVMAYAVAQRSSEIGLRMALGASSVSVLQLILGKGLALSGIGVTLGLTAALISTRLLTTMLFQVKPSDPIVYVSVVVLLAVVALLASYVPARRASRIEPLAALRQE